VTSTLGFMVVFVVVVGLVIAVGITVGMIVAGRIDRIMAPPGAIGPGSAEPAADPQPDSARIEEHDE
jgi:MFS superfamily sulfate permease-like transporter